MQHPIGVFDSGYGGLTVFKSIVAGLPGYDYIYLGDNGRAPYGNRSFDTVHEYTLECVKWFFEMGCPLVILACNTASAKALRTIQQQDLPLIAPENRVLGVIRPTAEVIGSYTRNGYVGVMGTQGTVSSRSYPLEINKFFPRIRVSQQACPLLVPLIENNEYDSPGTDYFVAKYLDELLSQEQRIDTILLACTHYPILEGKIRNHLSPGITLVSQGDIVAESLAEYLRRHPEMDQRISRSGDIRFFTTDDAGDFEQHGSLFFGAPVRASHVKIG